MSAYSPARSVRTFDVASRPLQNGTEMRIKVSGAFDEIIAPTLQRTIESIRLAPRDRVILDLHDADSADAAALRVVVGLCVRCVRAHCELSIQPGLSAVEQFFGRTAAGEILPFVGAQ